MLIIARKRTQKIILANNIEITILDIGSTRVRLGVQAPSDVKVHTRSQSLPVEGEVQETGEEKTTDPARSEAPPPSRGAAAANGRKRRDREA